MVLTVEEKKLFFKIWLKLLVYVNDEYKLVYDFGRSVGSTKVNINDAVKVRNKLWENSFLIDKYISTAKLSDADSEIVNLWKKFVKGKFILIKELQKYCIFLDIKTEAMYGVNGLSDPFSDMVPHFPIMIETVLIPFKGKIVYDGLMSLQNIEFGPNYRKSFEEKYKEIKEKKGLIEVL
jgi:hypothetical protein